VMKVGDDRGHPQPCVRQVAQGGGERLQPPLPRRGVTRCGTKRRASPSAPSRCTVRG
jgi:hypothetical protein